MLALECLNLNQDSAKHTPQPVFSQMNQEPKPQDSQTFPHYLQTVRMQIACAKDVHDILADWAKKLNESHTQS